jgi:hypothetical protein
MKQRAGCASKCWEEFLVRSERAPDGRAVFESRSWLDRNLRRNLAQVLPGPANERGPPPRQMEICLNLCPCIHHWARGDASIVSIAPSESLIKQT